MALKFIVNGDCLYNFISFFFCGDEIRSNWLRFLVVEELYLNVEYYVTYEIFKNFVKFIDISELVLFIVVLIVVGDKIILDGGS